MNAFNKILTLGILGLSTTSFAVVKKKAEALKVDTTASSVNWHATKVAGFHEGVIAIKSGELTLKGEKLEGGKFVIDMATLSSTDVKDAELKGKLDGHLKSPDFFNVAANPESTFVISKVESIKDAKADQPNVKITGKLTMVGKTNELTFPATVKVEKGAVTGAADITVDRTKWDLKYGSASFFKSLGDKAISNEFTLKISLNAKK